MLSLWKIQFPIFPISDTTFPFTTDNMLVVEDSKGEYKVIDNMSMPGTTLGLRRLQHEAVKGIFHRKLFKLSKPLYNLTDMLHKKVKKFIDSSGKQFNYSKNTFVPLECYKLDSFIETPSGYILIVHGIHCRFFINSAPQLHEKFVQVLRVGKGFILYQLTDTCKSTSRLKI